MSDRDKPSDKGFVIGVPRAGATDATALPPPAVDVTAREGAARGERDEAYCPACNQSYAFSVETCPTDGARLVKLKAARDPLIGRVFEGRYEIRTLLGEGGMGSVYRGWQLSVDREVAIKVVHPSIASDRTAVKRFLREARLSSRLSQPSIVNVYDFGQTEDGILYLVMELLRGHSLAHELEAKRPLPLRRVVGIALQLCDALEAAHTSATAIVHRDLKPGNIVVLDDPPGRDLIKVLDFGLAKSLVGDESMNVTHTNAILGTPLYMSPEQIDGRAVDHRTDLYALGCILFQMLSGRPPYLGDTQNAVLAAHLADPLPLERLPATTPRAMIALVDKLMAKDAGARLASAALARDALQDLAEGGWGAPDLSDTAPDIAKREPAATEVELARTAPSRSPPAPARRPRWVVVVVAIAVVVAAAAIVIVREMAKAKPSSIYVPYAVFTDAAPVPVVDAPPPATIDAAPIDAPPISIDAPPKPAVHHHVAPPPPHLPKPDANTAPNIDFLPSK